MISFYKKVAASIKYLVSYYYYHTLLQCHNHKVSPGQVLTKHSWPLDLDTTDMTSVSPVVTGPAPGQDQGQLQVMPTAGSWRVPFKGKNILSF